MKIELPEGIKKATRGKWKLVRDITTDAFENDPFNLWIFGHTKPMKTLFGAFAQDIYLKKGFCHLLKNDAATMWAGPGADISIPPTTLMRLGLAQQLFGSKGSIERGSIAGEAMQAAHPTEPHFYLFTVGVRQSAQGQGLGKAILRPVLTTADTQNLPVYLENTNPKNHTFYESLGFEKTGELDLPSDAPVVSTMMRYPK